MKAMNIEWDIDLEDDEDYQTTIENLGLPTETEIPVTITDLEDITDWLSDEFGYCLHGFELSADKKSEV